MSSAHNPFKSLLKDVFVDSTGKLRKGLENSKDTEAGRIRARRKLSSLRQEFFRLEEHIDSLYKKGEKERGEGKPVKRLLALSQRAEIAKEKQKALRKEIRVLTDKLENKNG